ncbi:MAG: LURP-one-related family protein, partial [Clostridiales bacterium]|nr:LURP-one-related family protein [Candidatus Blautia equi]
MRLLFKERLFSWFDSYDIYDEAGNTVFRVEGKLSWGHKLVIYDAYGTELGTVQERILTILPKFEIYAGSTYMGCISKEFSFFTPHYNIDFNGWHIDGTILEWDYTIQDRTG